jgi:hypothetical protein
MNLDAAPQSDFLPSETKNMETQSINASSLFSVDIMPMMQ